MIARKCACVQPDGQMGPVRGGTEFSGSARQDFSQAGDAALQVARFKVRCGGEAVQAANLDFEGLDVCLFQDLDLGLQLRLSEIIVISWGIYQEAAHKQSDVRLASIGFEQVTIEMFSGGFESFLNSFIFQCQYPNSI